VERFLTFAKERPASLSLRGGAEEVLQGYLAGLRSGALPAPKSEPTLARSALRKLAAYLEAK
jgi:hypothetical protein